jgi:hypothetical protein
MKAILGIGIFTLAIWLALVLLAGQAGAQDYPWMGPGTGWYPWYSMTYDQAYYEMMNWYSRMSIDRNMQYLINGRW